MWKTQISREFLILTLRSKVGQDSTEIREEPERRVAVRYDTILTMIEGEEGTELVMASGERYWVRESFEVIMDILSQ